MVQREIGKPVAKFAAEAAARPLPLKRQCSARLRVGAEPRVYPRPSEAALPCPFTGRCRAAGLPALHEDGRAMRLVMWRTDSNDPAAWFAAEAAARHLPLKRQCCATRLWP